MGEQVYQWQGETVSARAATLAGLFLCLALVAGAAVYTVESRREPQEAPLEAASYLGELNKRCIVLQTSKNTEASKACKEASKRIFYSKRLYTDFEADTIFRQLTN